MFKNEDIIPERSNLIDDEDSHLNDSFNMDSEEEKEFNRYAEHLVGGPRKIKQLIKSYQVARYIASRVNRAGGGEVSREKLLKFVILLG